MPTLRSLEKDLTSFLKDSKIPARRPLLLALSGGADSVCLFHLLLLHRTKTERDFACAHYNHRTRRSSDLDEAFVRDLCKKHGVRLFAGKRRGEVAHLSEAQMRFFRKGFLQKTATRNKYRNILTAHQQNDQAETFLLRLIRGTGPEGLIGLRPQSPGEGIEWLRPLLKIPRTELAGILLHKKLEFREDPSNRDRRYLRSRVRHELMPLLTTFNPNIVELVAQCAGLMAEENAAMDRIVGQGRTSLRVDAMEKDPLALKRRKIRRSIEAAKGDLRKIQFAHIEAVLGLLTGGNEVHLPDALTVRRRGNMIHFTPHDKQRKTSGKKR